MASTRRITCSKDILGKGSFAIVCKGTFDGKPVAVKRMLIEDVYAQEEFLEKYKHPDILELFHSEDDDNFRQFLVFNQYFAIHVI